MRLKIKNAEDFALAVVQSSNPDLSVDAKLNLYVDAIKKVNEYNESIPTPKGIVNSYN